MNMRRFAFALTAMIIAVGLSFVFASCASRADAQTPFPAIYHRDFGATTCYYTMNNADVIALSCVKEK